MEKIGKEIVKKCKRVPWAAKFLGRIMYSIHDKGEWLYITRFNKEALSIDEADDKILVAAFTNGLRKGKFMFSLYKNDPKTMSEVLYRATKYMNAKDALSAREDKPRKRERPEDTRQDHGKKKARTGDRREGKRSKPPGGRFTRFTPLNAPLDQVLMQIKDEGSLTFPGKLKSDPGTSIAVSTAITVTTLRIAMI